MARLSKRLLPVLLGHNRESIMANATIVEEPSRTVVTIVVEGSSAEAFAEFVTVTEPVAMSFTAIPVQPRKSQHIKEN